MVDGAQSRGRSDHPHRAGDINRGAPDSDDGLPHRSAASFDNLRVILKSYLTERVASISHRRSEMCAALAAMADC